MGDVVNEELRLRPNQCDSTTKIYDDTEDRNLLREIPCHSFFGHEDEFQCFAIGVDPDDDQVPKVLSIWNRGDWFILNVENDQAVCYDKDGNVSPT